jgi:hypothetical protein
VLRSLRRPLLIVRVTSRAAVVATLISRPV